ncbi:4-hydroxybutyrate coenzyme A transferase [Vibrio orientalis CIP 102891 = ATCC 33934]|uniref:4-hydroxybutyrate CoA-transferase n=1 Tax=Vibrio orientalis CIP 102891 = ATCC 33934 TaxID=675816 RepID=C9QLV8_VIBOR|nr:acetyl-CoA hydrolase/transferase C-terminal domain-containing protein [Vibrio orientalis]EEX92884.1 4-hydroxybutyrate CoA-transferase [Vibrio orientalis CIP 102891 = ATCC 33934]EGU46566.1 4-hydroxybutyrate coenzyme A transferase [Vibrio orientalis CIP 102891 = ATCC 33934]
MKKWQELYQDKLITVASAVDELESGDKIWAGGFLSNPVLFLRELDKHLTRFEGGEIYTGLMTAPYEFLKPQYKKNLRHFSLFMGPLERKCQNGGNVEIINFHFSNIDQILTRLQPNVVVIEATPPNEQGYMSLGACGGVGNKEALKYADKVIFVVNKYQPFIGNIENMHHVDDVDFLIEGDHPIASPSAGQPTELENQIATHVTPYIKDGMTIQIGIGTISNAMGMALKEHKNLGIHTEMFTESLMALCKSGSVTGSEKNHKPNKIVTAFAGGSQEVMDFLDGNTDVEMGEIHKVVNPNEVAKNDNFASINTCIMVDLVGQVASEGVGFTQISGSGGQLDFIRGANMATGGISILALASTREGNDGLESNIRVDLPTGTPITTPRNDTHVVATEFGSEDLRALSTSERAKALIRIAHPDFRESLTDEAIKLGLIK